MKNSKQVPSFIVRRAINKALYGTPLADAVRAAKLKPEGAVWAKAKSLVDAGWDMSTITYKLAHEFIVPTASNVLMGIEPAPARNEYVAERAALVAEIAIRTADARIKAANAELRAARAAKKAVA